MWGSALAPFGYLEDYAGYFEIASRADIKIFDWLDLSPLLRVRQRSARLDMRWKNVFTALSGKTWVRVHVYAGHYVGRGEFLEFADLYIMRSYLGLSFDI